MELPAGFRFHPTDEELITHYLTQKVTNNNFSPVAIGETDFNKVEPWDLPLTAKMGENEWYFFCVRDRKYPTGLRTNRATETGYWKATGKDKEIYRAKVLVGMKKTLVFYTGRAPKGLKTNWIMHEYRLEGKSSKCNFSETGKKEWVLSRVFKKSLGEKKPELSWYLSVEELQQPPLPPLMECSSHSSEEKEPMMANPSYASCFRGQPSVPEDRKPATTSAAGTSTVPLRTATQQEHPGLTSTTNFTGPCSSSPYSLSTKFSLENTFMEQSMGNIQHTDSNFMQDQSILNLLQGNDTKVDLSQENCFSFGNMNTDFPFMSNHDQIIQTTGGPIDLECLWDY